jgi:hypothetical protein
VSNIACATIACATQLYSAGKSQYHERVEEAQYARWAAHLANCRSFMPEGPVRRVSSLHPFHWLGQILGLPNKLVWLIAGVVLLWTAAAAGADIASAQQVTFQIRDVSQKVKQKFRQEFSRRKRTLERYLTSTNFTQLFSGNIRVEVFHYMPPVSEGLLPGWEGNRGYLKFAALRAKDGTAAITHELTHVHAPNQVRFLAEGFAVYVEEMIGNIDVYPTFGDSIEGLVKNHAALNSVRLDLFDAVSTQRGHLLGDNVGLQSAISDARDRQNYSYLVSGSFVKFLVESYGLIKFKAFYNLTPLTPGVATAADPNRYSGVFGKSLTALETEWRSWLVNR